MVNNASDLANLLQQKMEEDNGSDTSSKISDVPSVPSQSSDSEDESSKDGPPPIGKDPKVRSQIESLMQMRGQNNVFDQMQLDQDGDIKDQVIVEKEEEDSKTSEFASEKDSSGWGSEVNDQSRQSI